MDKRHAKAVQRCKETGKFVKKRKMCTKTFLIIENILVWSFLVTGMDSTATWTIDNPIVETARADSVGTGEEPEDTSVLSDEDMDSNRIEALVRRTFPEDPDTAVAVAMAESGMNPETVGDRHLTFVRDGKTYGMSCGIMQIRNLPGRPDCESMKDPVKNVEYARSLYERSGWKPWGAYTNGSFKKYLK